MSSDRTPADVIERFIAKVDKRDDGCWIWTASKNERGYGQFRLGGTMVKAHRLSYEMFVGPIPDGLTIDHLCRNRACVSPAHLEPVTSRENTLRGDTVPAAHAAKSHCPKGHLYDEANTHTYNGKRHCRTCRRESARKRYWAKKESR